MGQEIDLKKLSTEQRKELMVEAAKLQKAEKEKKKANREAYKELSNEFVENNIELFVMHYDATEKIVSDLFGEFEKIKALKKEVYGNKVEGQNSHTSTLPDGSASITIGWNTSIGFDGTESEGVQKIKNFTASLSSENDEERFKKQKKMVDIFLKPNEKTGELNPSRIIELAKLRDDFQSEEFNEGLDIIFNAQQVRRNSMFVSGWKFVKEEGKPPRKVTFRFSL